MQIDESKVMSGPFLFISYSHMDANAVRSDANALCDQGVRVWIDHRSEEEEFLKLGDNWQKKVEAALSHPNCCGALFYVSRYSLASKAVQKEQALIQKKAQEEDFPFYCVSMEGKNISMHFSGALALCSDETSVWYDGEYLMTAMRMQQDMFNGNILHLVRSDENAAHLTMIVDKIAKPLGAMDDTGSLIKRLAEDGVVRSTGEIILGIYKGEKSEPVAQRAENARFVLSGRDYIHHGNAFYMGRPLRWKLLYVKDATAVLICSEIIEKYAYVKAQEFFGIFRKLAFTDLENKIVKTVRLFNDADADILAHEKDKVKNMLSLPEQQTNMYWWVEQDGILPNWKKTYRGHVVSSNGFLVTQVKGIRPVIEVASADLERK